MSFGDDLAKFRRRTLDKYIRVKRLSAFDLFSAIILETPVDKGVLRNNWFAEIGNGSSETTDSEDPSGQRAINRTRSVLEGTDIARDIFFTNNLPYAVPIEFDGISGKAPEGMVRINALRWDNIVRRNVRKVQNGG
jgi:hypothetical protein